MVGVGSGGRWRAVTARDKRRVRGVHQILSSHTHTSSGAATLRAFRIADAVIIVTASAAAIRFVEVTTGRDGRVPARLRPFDGDHAKPRAIRRSAHNAAGGRSTTRKASSVMAGVNRSAAARPSRRAAAGPCTIGHWTTAAATSSRSRRPSPRHRARLAPHSPTRVASIPWPRLQMVQRRGHVGALGSYRKALPRFAFRCASVSVVERQRPMLRLRSAARTHQHHVVRRAEAVHQHDAGCGPGPIGSVNHAAHRVARDRKSIRWVGWSPACPASCISTVYVSLQTPYVRCTCQGDELLARRARGQKIEGTVHHRRDRHRGAGNCR